MKVKKIRNDHGGEFENNSMDEFYQKKGILHDYFIPRKPQQNGIEDRKKISLIEMARVMLNEKDVQRICGLKQLRQHVMF